MQTFASPAHLRAHRVSIAIAAIFSAAFAIVPSLFAETITVPGTANPWLAGAPAGTTAIAGDVAPANSPVRVSVEPGRLLLLTATGGTNNVPSAPGTDPDGGGMMSHGDENGILSLTAPLNSLIGVFLPGNDAGSGVPTGGTTTSGALTPAIRQPFFIGKRASVKAPENAAYLYLGSMDGYEWNNNTGAFDVQIVPGEGHFVPIPLPVYNGRLQDFNTAFPSGDESVLANVPFNIPVQGNNYYSTEFASGGSPQAITLTIPTETPGVLAAHLLINCFWGERVAGTFASLTFRFSDGSSVVKALDGDSDVRDFFHGGFANQINGTTTINAFSTNAVGSIGAGTYRLDKVHVDLSSHLEKTLTSIVVTDVGSAGFQRIFVAGVTLEALLPQPPVAFPAELATREDVPLFISLNADSPTGTPLEFQVVTSPQGSLSGSGKSRTYTPPLNWSGTDTFTFKVNNGSQDSNLATVTIQVTPVNDPPSFESRERWETAEDSGLQIVAHWASAITPGPADESSQSVSFTVVGNTNPGLFKLGSEPTLDDAGTLKFTPAENAHGSATISIVLQDDGGVANGGDDTSATRSFEIVITPVNDCPRVADKFVATPEDQGLTILPEATDPDGDDLFLEITTPAVHGTVFTNNGQFSYTPHRDFHGTDSFAFRVSDGLLTKDATIYITVTPVNDPPQASLFGSELRVISSNNVDAPVVLNGASSTDIDGDDLTFLWIDDSTPLVFGTQQLIRPILAIGTHKIMLRVSDGRLTSEATIFVHVLSAANAAHDLGTLIGISQIPETTASKLLSFVQNAEALFQKGSMVAGANQLFAFQKFVQAQAGKSIPSLLAFTLVRASQQMIDAVNGRTAGAPGTEEELPLDWNIAVTNQSVGVYAGDVAEITLECENASGLPVDFVILSMPVQGTLTGSIPNLRYTPNDGFRGTDSFTWVATNGIAKSDVAVVSITVMDGSAPIAVANASFSEAQADEEENLTEGESIVALSGSASKASSGGALSYRWFEKGSSEPFAITEQVELVLAPGTYEFELVVTDELGVPSDAATVEVEVLGFGS